MKSYLFTTETDRGGVMLCDIDDFDEGVKYLCHRFDGVVRVEAGEQLWELEAGKQPARAFASVPGAYTEQADNQEQSSVAGTVAESQPEPHVEPANNEADLFG
ncbi:hypothetical protein [Amphritea balenae]|uniref:Uncharacterized protein n=1 Tax=Amphritea balenae TaxID=452629 RepID=A0A3P1SIH7_9GAMM|nr:hypothetical protein [Amphritea balenae]RRC96846.1 hypothetical protein EHS89_20030 [Amphritea balenae]GGK61203.1 hypothetical protein GCM10007941_09300 [Amphritea balenae]